MQELRYNTEQIVRVGVLLAKTKDNPIIPVTGATLNWFWWRYLIKSDGTVIDIINFYWNDIPNCDGCYFLTFPMNVCDKLGSLILYIHDSFSLGKPIFMEFNVITQNEWDSKYGNSLLSVEQDSKLG